MTSQCVWLIILWWVSTRRKGKNVWWCNAMCSKRGVSGQAACSYLMMGSWENDRCGIILEQFGLPKKPADARVGKPCRLWIPSRAAGGCGHSRKPKLQLLSSLLQRWDFWHPSPLCKSRETWRMPHFLVWASWAVGTGSPRSHIAAGWGCTYGHYCPSLLQCLSGRAAER